MATAPYTAVVPGAAVCQITAARFAALDQAQPKKVMLTVFSFGLGGTDRVAAYLANGLSDHAEIHLVSAISGGEGHEPLSQLTGGRITLHRLIASTRASRVIGQIRAFPALVRTLRRVQPDRVIATGNNIAWFTAIAYFLAFGRRPGFFVKVTNPIVRPKDKLINKWFRSFGYNRVFSLATHVLALSDAEGRVLKADFPKLADRFRSVTNPYVTPEMLTRSNEGKSDANSHPLVIAVGRLHHQKRFDRLLRAWQLVQHPAAKLIIIGEGPDRKALEALALELGIANRVEMPGYSNDVAGWLAKANIFALSSDYEGLPAVVLEAMAFNCPVVMTDCFPAARELVENVKNCHVVDKNDEAALAKRIDEVLVCGTRPTTLRSVAKRYSIAAGVESHRAALYLSAA
jgi:glycosyltransferase involved in cell wall biosynthesis